jgi:hypothetical protein
MNNRTPNLGIPIPYPRSANVDELFDWEKFLHDAFMVVDNADILFSSRIRVAGNRPLSTLLSELGSAGGGLLYFPTGVYEINNTLIVPANVRLMSNNAVLRPTASFYNSGNNAMFSVAGDGVVFEGLTFEGHPTNNDVRVSAIATNGYETTVIRCRFLRMGYTAIDHRSTTRNGLLRMRDSRFEDCWGDCILTNLSVDADSVVFSHPSSSISTVAAFRGYGVGIKAETQEERTLKMVLRNVEFDRLLRTAIVLTANPSHPAYEVRINGVKVKQVGLSRFANPSGEASAIGNDESLYGALIYVKSTASGGEADTGTVHISDFDVDEPFGFVVRFPANNEKRHYLSRGRYKHSNTGWSGSNPFNPISLRLARAFISDVEGHSLIRHFTKQSDAFGSYDVVFQNCRFASTGDFGGTLGDQIWFINCTFLGTAPAPKGGWFIGCKGASQYLGDKVIASEGGHISSSTIHLGTFQTGMCFKTTANYGQKPQITAVGRLAEANIRSAVLLPPNIFYVAEGDEGTTVFQNIHRHPTYDEIVSGFNDGNRLPNGNHRRLIATVPLPRNFYVPSSNESAFALKLRVSFSFSQGRADLIPIRVRIKWRKHGETTQTTKTLHSFQPLTTQPITADSIYNAEFVLSPADLPSYATNGGCLTIDIARRYVADESDIVRVHGVELLYSALLEP